MDSDRIPSRQEPTSVRFKMVLHTARACLPQLWCSVLQVYLIPNSTRKNTTCMEHGPNREEILRGLAP